MQFFKVIICLFLFMPISNSWAQTKGFGLGVVGGINASLPTGENIYKLYIQRSYTGGLGQLYGLQMQYKANPYFSFHTGCLQLGANYEGQQSFQYRIGESITVKEEIPYKEHLSYLNLPLFVRIGTKPFKKWRAFLDLGIYFSYLIQSNMEVSNTTITLEEDFSGNITETQSNKSMKLDTRSIREDWDFGLLLGLGSSYDLNKFTLSSSFQFLSSGKHINHPNSGKTQVDPIQFWDYFILEDIIRLNYLSFNLGLTYHFNQ